MPILPENRAKYPKDWPAIRARIQRRAGNRCEECGVANHAVGFRAADGAFVPVPDGKPGALMLRPSDGRQAKLLRIVCTTMHLDHQPENCEDGNLRFACQRCHLRYDARHHAQTAAKTRREHRAMADLFTSLR